MTAVVTGTGDEVEVVEIVDGAGWLRYDGLLPPASALIYSVSPTVDWPPQPELPALSKVYILPTRPGVLAMTMS